MNDKVIAILIIIISITLAIIIKIILDWEDQKEKSKERKDTINKNNIIPTTSIFSSEEEYSIKELLNQFTKDSIKKIPIGFNEKKEAESINLEKQNHIFIIGTTGGGKSILLNEIIANTIFNYNAEELKIVAMDTSIVELSSFNGIPHYLKDTLVSPIEIIAELYDIDQEINRRKKEKKKTNLLVIIDDYYDICSYDPKVSKMMERLLKESKNTGIHFVLATDTPSKEMMTDNFKNQIDAFFYLTLSPGEIKDFSLDLTPKELEYTKELGNAIYKTKDKKEKIKIPDISEDEIKAIKNCYQER